MKQGLFREQGQTDADIMNFILLGELLVEASDTFTQNRQLKKPLPIYYVHVNQQGIQSN